MTTTNPVVVQTSHATRALGSSAIMASKTASEIWSQSLSGCPSVTDSDVNRYDFASVKVWLNVSSPESPPMGSGIAAAGVV